MSKSTENILIWKSLTPEEIMTRIGGEKLREKMSAALKLGKSITIDCENRPVASISFWDEGIAKLTIEGFSEAELWARVTFKNTLSRDIEVIRAMLKAKSKKRPPSRRSK